VTISTHFCYVGCDPAKKRRQATKKPLGAQCTLPRFVCWLQLISAG
jgi:hypothetical protein